FLRVLPLRVCRKLMPRSAAVKACRATRLLGYSATRLLGYSATRLLGYSATRPLGHSAAALGAELPSCPAAELPSCRAAELPSCRAAEQLRPLVRLYTMTTRREDVVRLRVFALVLVTLAAAGGQRRSAAQLPDSVRAPTASFVGRLLNSIDSTPVRSADLR